MRFLLTFSLSILFLNSFGQSKQDTLTLLEAKAREYLTQAYSNQNFESAITTWHDSVFTDIKDIYNQKGYTVSDQNDLIQKLRKDYQAFYALNKDFTLTGFDNKSISDESRIPVVNFKYAYKEKVNNKSTIGTSYLYFIFDEKQATWKIWDFRISEILGVPRRWLK